ncbi:transglycosylase SLT domain-containing protein [Mycoavidus sp. B2-EB]|uniref:transglycosylase SLT domain-containing protein n=1 Tax=Mycoavidus sp. B2-EB TaxID=2651972 RepID=UPI001629689D|nr:transglycosylase SLT domain-containing protein [Mycoavidus sp. B2-EB]
MRFIFSVLCAVSAVLLASCASTPPANIDSTLSPADARPSFLSSLTARFKTADVDQTIDLDHDSVDAHSGKEADLWNRIRRGFQIPELRTNLAQAQLSWYLARPEYVQRMTERSKLYLYHIVEALEARNMPTELALLPFIESAYNPQALSIAQAAGMWQFIPGTGRSYNLKQNIFLDERRDVLASTNAALDYLTKLHDMFGDWRLALAAYNWGEGNVLRAIARNRKAGRPTDYLSLKIPTETRNYVPKLQAVKDIIAHPEKYGLTLPSIPDHPYFVTVTTTRDIDVAVAARLAGLSVDAFRALNPSFSKPVILGATQPQILLPFENAQMFEQGLKTYQGLLSSWTTYTVTKRERTAALATKIGVDPATLVAVNQIPAGMRLKPGSTVLIPKAEDEDEDISAHIAENAVFALEPDGPDTRKMLIRVRRHETMAAFAKRYRVSVTQVQAWNHTKRARLTPGQIVMLHLPISKKATIVTAKLRARPLPAAHKLTARTVKLKVQTPTIKHKTQVKPIKALANRSLPARKIASN